MSQTEINSLRNRMKEIDSEIDNMPLLVTPELASRMNFLFKERNRIFNKINKIGWPI